MSHTKAILFAIAAGCAIIANVYFVRAVNHRTPDAPESASRILFWSHFAAGRKNFSPLGWRYRRIAVSWAVAAAAVVVASWFVG
jgi:hypothetical protein